MKVTAGRTHSVALLNGGSVVAWGANTSGQVGDTTTVQRLTPVAVIDASTGAQLSGVAEIDAGRLHTLARKSNGTVVAWGHNSHGQLGDGTLVDSLSAKAVSGLSGVVDIAGGGIHSVALKSDGTAVAFGAGGNGALGDGCDLDASTAITSDDCARELLPVAVINLTGVTEVGAGDLHSVAVVS